MFSLIKGVLGFFSTIGGLIALFRRRQDVQAGQLQQQNADLKENAAAARRVQEAQAQPRGREVTQDALDKGTF